MTRMTHAALSDPGRKQENQDRLLIDPDQGLYLVSDGMAESLSPQLVVERLPELLRESLAGVRGLADEHAPRCVRWALTEISQQVRAERDQRMDMLGATIVLALVRDRQALIAHLGDSRAYLLREGKLQRLTCDHSFVQRLLDLGWLNAEEARQRGNGGPTRYAGMHGVAEADVRHVELLAGDRLLLCSDGLTELVSDEALAPLLNRELTPQQSCEQLVGAANQAGGDDNITVVVLDV
ncbi:MAG: protein phosphatase 2C domain-containing protein [Gemmataceae bacterium]|nr:protein phosphatase 2C domain-containing protein [Gemmataceae bacterium]